MRVLKSLKLMVGISLLGVCSRSSIIKKFYQIYKELYYLTQLCLTLLVNMLLIKFTDFSVALIGRVVWGMKLLDKIFSKNWITPLYRVYLMRLKSDSHFSNSVMYFNESPLKIMKNAFILKALFVLKIFKFLSWLFGHVGKTTWLGK